LADRGRRTAPVRRRQACAGGFEVGSNSPGTDQIDTLLWIGFVAATIVVVAVNVGLIYALGRNRAGRGTEPREVTGGRGIQWRVGGGLAAFAVILFVLATVYTSEARESPASGPSGLAELKGEPLRIEATGQQWLWRYDYPNEAFTYYKLVVPVDTAVDLNLVSTDVVHTWDVPSLAGKRDAVPGKSHHVLFRAEEEGTYRGQSATLSGQGYAAMRTEVEVVSANEYEDFVEGTKSDIQAAQDRVAAELGEGS
jgi:cytochrome c oxidase subunit II